MNLQELIEKLSALFDELPSNYGFIAYIFDRSPDGMGGGFHRNADMGDALVAIQRIAEIFDIDLEKIGRERGKDET